VAARALRASRRHIDCQPTGAWHPRSKTTGFAGRLDDAEALFDRLLSLRNHLGLLAEEYEPALNRQIGNFPQAFSHLALIMTARAIETGREARGQASQRAAG
jgi:hypothetical protein